MKNIQKSVQLLCLFFLFTSTILGNGVEHDTLNFKDKWPDCEEPVAYIHYETDHRATLTIENYFDELEYEVLRTTSGSTDSTINKFTEFIEEAKSIRSYDYHIRAICPFGTSNWVSLFPYNAVRSQACFPDTFFHHAYVTSSNKIYVKHQGPNMDYSPYLNHHLKFEIHNIYGSTLEYITKDPVSSFIDLNNSSEYAFVFNVHDFISNIDHLESVEISLGDVIQCQWTGNVDNCTSAIHPASCSESSDIIDGINTYQIVPFSQFHCVPDYNVICGFNNHIKGEITGTTLRLYNESLTTQEFEYYTDGLDKLHKIEFIIEGRDFHDILYTEKVTFYDSNQNSDIENWEVNIPNFGSYTNIKINTGYYRTGGDPLIYEACDGTNQLDLPTDHNQDLCDKAGHVFGTVDGSDVWLKFLNFTEADFELLVDEFHITKLEMTVTGFNSLQSQSEDLLLHLESSTIQFNPETWTHALIDFAQYENIEVSFTYESNYQPYTCQKLFDVQLDDIYCGILSLMRYDVFETSNKIVFSFKDADNPSYLQSGLADLGLDINSANELIASSYDDIAFTFEFQDENNNSYTENYFYDVTSQFNLVNFKFQFTLPTFESIAGQLDMHGTLISGTTKDCILYPIQYTKEGGLPQDIPDLNCDSNATDADITDYTPVNVPNEDLLNEIFTMNGLPFVLTEITSGTNITGINGKGLMAIPFKKKKIYVHLNNVQFNAGHEGIAGVLSGEDGPAIDDFPEFNLPPVYLGGEICQDPPVKEGAPEDGFDPVNGLNAAGFDENGNHYITNGPYDPDGFDKDGNHEDTGKKWNEDGCTRDGELWAPNEDGEYVDTGEKCDPTGGAPPHEEFETFKNTKGQEMTANIDSIYALIKQEHLDDKTGFDSAFDTKRSSTDISFVDHQDAAFGTSNKLISKEMSTYFKSDPKTLAATRTSEEWSVLEKDKVELYGIDKDLQKSARREEFVLALEPQSPQMKAFIKGKLNELSNNEYQALKDDEAYFNWIKTMLMLFINENSDYEEYVFEATERSQDFRYPYNDLKSGYYDLASNAPMSVDHRSVLENMQWQYEQGFEKINGVERAFVDQMIKEKQYAYFSNSQPIENLLPVHVKTEMVGYEIDLFLKNIIVSPTSATLEGGAVITNLKDKKEKFAIGATGIEFTKGGFKEGKLELKNEVKIKLINSASLNLKPTTTYVYFDCNGYAGAQVTASVEFCPNYILGLDASGQPDHTKNYELDIQYTANPGESWLDFNFEVDADPFVLTNYPQFKFNQLQFGVDLSKKKSPNLTSTNIPLDYESPHYNGTKLLDSWTGFYIRTVDVDVSMFDKDFAIIAKSMLFDKYGMSGYLGGGSSENPLLTSGEVNGWEISLDEIYLLFLNNSIGGGGFGGDIAMPILSQPLDYTAIVSLSGNADLKIEVDKPNKFSVFDSDVTLKKNSYVQSRFNFTAAEDDSDFEFIANLTGEIKFKQDLDSKLKMPKVLFEKVRYTSKPGPNGRKFSPGYWGVAGAVNGEPLFSGGGLTLYKLALVSMNNPDEVALNVDAEIGLTNDNSGISARGDFLIVGKEHPEGRFIKYRYDRIEVNKLCLNMNFKEKFKFNGCIEFFGNVTPHPDYGEGFRGAIDVEMQMKGGKSMGFQAAALFGKVDNHKYWFVDLAIKGDFITLYEVLTINRLGGGMSNGMNTDYTETEMKAGFVESTDEYLEKPIGTTLTGTHYTPDVNAGITFKLFCTFYVVDETTANGLAEIILRFNQGQFSLQDMEFRGQVQMAASKQDGPPNQKAKEQGGPTTDEISNSKASTFGSDMLALDFPDANISGVVGLKLNFETTELHGFAAIYLKAGPLTGNPDNNNALVKAELYIGPNDWYFYLGKPQRNERAMARLDLAIIKADLSAYFNIGTKIPPFPGLPPKVAHLGKSIHINEAARQSGKGIAFGADFNFDLNLGSKTFGTGIFLSIGAGFDVMLKHYAKPICRMDPGEKFGINNYYAMGQAWGYIDGQVLFLGKNILSGGVAAVIQLQGPSPTSLYANLEFKYGSKVKHVDFEAGDPCLLDLSHLEDPLDLELFKRVSPGNNSVEVPLKAQAQVDLNFNIKTTVKDFIDPYNSDLVTLIFELDENDSGIFGEYGKVDAELINKGRSIYYRPTEFLEPDATYVIKTYITVHGAEESHEYTRLDTFQTSSEYKIIPEDNVSASMPINGMTNYYIDDNESNTGFIQLERPQYKLFSREEDYDENGNPLIDLPYLAIVNGNGSSSIFPVEYNPSTFRISFELPSESMQEEQLYKLELRVAKQIPSTEVSAFFSGEFTNYTANSRNVDSNDASPDQVLYAMYFRTSKYRTFTDKVAAMQEVDIDLSQFQNQMEDNTRSGDANPTTGTIHAFSYEIDEIFDPFELLGYKESAGFIDFTLNRTISKEGASNILYVHEQEAYPLQYNGIFYSVDTINGKPVYYNYLSTGATDYSYRITKDVFENNSFQVRSGKQAIIYYNHKFSLGSLNNEVAISYNFPGNLLAKTVEDTDRKISASSVTYLFSDFPINSIPHNTIDKIIKH